MRTHATPALNTAMYPCNTLPGLAIIHEEAAANMFASPHGDSLLQLGLP